MRKWCLLAVLSFQGLAALSLDDKKIVIQELVNANYQKDPKLTMLQLFKVDDDFFNSLREEVFALIQDNNPSYVTDPTHLSYWSRPEGLITQYSLLNVSGKLDDYSTDHNRSIKHKIFAHAHKHPNLAQLISLFPHSINFRINILNAKSRFTQHQENICFLGAKTKEPSLRVRFHLPIFTNPEANMLMEGDVYHFEPGNIYFFHNGCIHDGVNQSETDSRIHLIWDMLLTQDTFERMFKRTIKLPHLSNHENTALTPISTVGIDPDYKKTLRIFDYEHAKKSILCPIQ